MQRIGVGLVHFGGEDMRAERPVARGNRDGHLEQRREILPHVKLGILAADEDGDLAGTPGRFRLCGRHGIGDASLVLLHIGRRHRSRYGRVGLLRGVGRFGLGRLDLVGRLVTGGASRP